MKVNALSFAVLMRVLNEDAHTIAELNEATGLHPQTIREWINVMHMKKVVFIAGYEKDAKGRDNAPYWQFGIDKTDAKRARLTSAERKARSRMKRKTANIFNLTPLKEAA